ncbi:aminoglycoside phosphotransferase family protein [Microbacterium invictum]|uniref:Aminoglycoside phosphotransferase family protein n=1 Tax=Microbacterium invictum TaxID=515415 RepID=A0ABZ0VBQ2_9MICO|nr:aminoglycoside phosphotransferase family protein [Microbacterium invictum]WQB70549.1 aminoglycoside phosphotransferase family protein [Microbacterium invictum]
MHAIPASFLAMPRWWHDDEGREWLSELPSLIDRQCATWQLTPDGEIRHGSNALVVPVRRGDEPAMLRLAPPGDDVAAEARALRHWAGAPVVELLDLDPPQRAMLLERLDANRSLASESVLAAMSVLGRLVSELATPAPVTVPSTREIAATSLSTFPLDWESQGRPTSRSVLDSTLIAAAELSSAPDEDASVNGDVHPDQVLAGPRRRWTVVDPVLLRGDIEYDGARALWSLLPRMRGDDDIRLAFHTFVDAAGVPEERARAWVLVRSMSYLLWGLDHGLTVDPPKCRRLLEVFT